MQSIVELLKFTFPSLIIAAVVYYLIDKFFKEEQLKREMTLRSTLAQNITPQKLQAYERMALFLERIRPTALVRRLQGYQTVKELEFAFIDTIQSEFEHNLSQQIYVNPETWKIIFSAKNSTQNFINECIKKLPENATVMQFQEEIIRSSIQDNNPSNYAMIYLQKDIQSNF